MKQRPNHTGSTTIDNIQRELFNVLNHAYVSIARVGTPLSCKAARGPKPSPRSMTGIRCCGIAAPPILAKATAR